MWDQNWLSEGRVGTHFIDVSGSGTSDADSYYVVRVPGQAGVIRYGQGVQGDIAKMGDYQQWKFTGNVGDIVTIHMYQDGGASLFPIVQLYDPSGTKIADESNLYDREARIANLPLLFSGTYKINAGGHYSTGGFRLSLSKN